MPKQLLNDKKLMDYLDGLERAGMFVTRQWHSIWQEAIMYIWGEQLKGIKKKPSWEYVIFNYIYPLVFQGIAKECKNNPKILGHAWKDEDAEFAEQWQGIIQYIWEQILNMRIDVNYALLDAMTFGYAVGKLVWNPKKTWNEKTLKWEGEIEHLLIHPAYFWCDPSAENLKNKPACGTIRPVSLEWAIQQWPEFEEELRIEANNVNPEDEAYRYANIRYGDIPGNAPLYPNQKAGLVKRVTSWLVSLIIGQKDSNTGESEGKTKEVWLKETYFPDESTRHIKIEDPLTTDELTKSGQATVEPASGIVSLTINGQPIKTEEWPKRVIREYDEPIFPKGRYVVRVGNTILNPKVEDQVYQYSRWPFNIKVHHILPHMWQGSNAVEMARSSQDILNITMSLLVHFVKVATNPVKVVEEGALQKGKDGKARRITGTDGEVIFVNQGGIGKIRNLEHGILGSEIPFLIDLVRRDMESNLFLHPTAQGAVDPKQMTRAEALTLNQNANDMVAMRSILTEKWIEGTAINIAELAQANYDVNRRMRIIGSNGNMANSIMTEQLKTVEWNLEIEPGSTLPFDEERQKADYLTAYKLLSEPVANPMLEDTLRILKIANRDKILMKHRQTQIFREFIAIAQQAQQMQTQMQQAAAGGQQMKPKQMAAMEQQAAMMKQQLMQKIMQLLQAAAPIAPGPTMKGAA